MRPFLALFALLITLSLSAAELPLGPENARPLAVGAEIPAVSLQAPDGSAVDLRALVLAQPTVLIVYRGGWCPFCNAHLGELAAIEPALAELGFRVVAFSPERPETLAAALAKHPAEQDRVVLSDRSMAASAALGLAYQMPPALQQKYLGAGLDLAPIPGSPDQHWLPVPAAYVVDSTGRVAFAHTNPDYRQRVETERLLEAARAARK